MLKTMVLSAIAAAVMAVVPVMGLDAPAGGTISVAGASLMLNGKVHVNEYFGMKYTKEPVSWDFDVPTAGGAGVPVSMPIYLKDRPTQVEIIEGTAETPRKIRVWTLVDFEAPGQQQFTIVSDAPPAESPFKVTEAEAVGGVKMATVSNGQHWAKVPVGTVTFDKPRSAFEVPGPVASVSADGKTWYGSGYIDSILRVKSITCTVEQGPVFWQSTIRYDFEQGKTYTAKVRMYPGKRYVALTEDFNLGGNSRYIFNYGDWTPPWVVSCGDQAQTKIYDAATYDSGDFVKEQGQRCLVRLVVWTQFGYFGGKSETIGLANEDGSLSVGGFYLRPDRWTRAKVNHVDLYERPEVPGDRMTRGVVGLAGAKNRYAMEAWLVDGHREWALYAMPTGPITPDEKGGPPKVEWTSLRKAHVTEGVWPLDRINRMPLVWNADGTPVKPEDTAPTSGAKMAYGGDINQVLKGMQGRAGLQHFNGSNGSMRGGYANSAKSLLNWLNANKGNMSAAKLQEMDGVTAYMVGPAMGAYMAMDESAYPGRRAMLPWSHPEALNPFYQGMENQNFNADRYNSVSAVGAYLAAAGHPEGKAILMHGEEQMDMALDRYVYPQSGTWEESHTYFMHTLKNLNPLAANLKARGIRNFYEDIRFARMFQWWCYTMSPRDPGFEDMRVQPPIGDHGMGGPDKSFEQLKTAIVEFAASKNPEIQKIARQMAWRMLENGVKPPVEIEPEQPDLNSRYVQGHGVIMRAWDAKERESFVTLRAEQSWGHHHMDKGSLWGWFRNVHFFGDAAWGGPPGATYGNSYKQGPASGTQIEFRGVTNWTLPAKYPAPWISDDEYKPGQYDYANARCMFPFNPKLDLTRSTPAVTRNGYDRQVLLVHPDLMIVRDNVETMCPTTWRMHSYQVDGTKVEGNRVTMASPHKVTGELNMVYPAGVTFTTTAVKDELDGDTNGVGTPFGEGGKGKSNYDMRSMVLRWDMPMNTSATWTFSARDEGEAAVASEMLDKEGKVTRVKLADGREVITLMAIEPFTYTGNGITFEGTVGLVVRENGKTTVHPIRAKTLKVE